MKHCRFLISLLLLPCLLTVHAEENAADPAKVPEIEPISPAIRVLAARQTLKKNAVEAWSEGMPQEAVCFARADFASVLGYTPSLVTITSLPDRSVGTLKLGTLEIAVGCALSPSAIEHLQFVPTAAVEGEAVRSASFTFTAEGKVYRTDTPLACQVYLLAEENAAPTAADVSGVTYTEIPLHGTLPAGDPDADSISYEIVRMPKKGSVSFDGASGTFVYTPAVGKRGTDVFTYRVSDRYGNKSEECRVEVEIRRAGEQFCYADLGTEDCAAAAMYLTDEGVLAGSALGTENLFSPDKGVTRGEFLMMAMNASGASDCSASTAVAPVFADHDMLPDYLHPYVTAAYHMGIISGTPDENGETVFAPDTPITGAEAAVIAARLFELPTENQNGGSVSVFAQQDNPESIPAWSVGAYAALDLVGGQHVLSPSGTVTRGEAAKLLAGLMWNAGQED